MATRSVYVPAQAYPVFAYIIWFYLFFTYLPVLETPNPFSRQILSASFFVVNLILVLTWFLCPRQIFIMFAAATIGIAGYLYLDLAEPAILLQGLMVLVLYGWLYYLTMRIHNERLQQLVEREKIRTRLNLSRQSLSEKDHFILALKKKSDRLSHLRDFSDRLKVPTDLRKTAQIITNELVVMLPHLDQALVFVIEEKSHDLELLSQFSREDSYVAAQKRGDEYDQWVIRRSQALLIEDSQHDYRFHAHTRGEPFRSICIVPLVSESKVFGAIHLNAQQSHVFGTDDLRFLDIVADLSAVALRNVLLYEKTKELSIMDSLTDCYLRRHIQDRLGQEIQRAISRKHTFAVLMLDIDHFKKYNDELGHTAGDIVLKGIAKTLKQNVSASDIVGRYGGEEFVVVLPQKNKTEARQVAEKLRREVEQKEFQLRKDVRTITVSIGVATFPEDGTTKEELLWKADQNLYNAKRRGRNRVCTSRS